MFKENKKFFLKQYMLLNLSKFINKFTSILQSLKIISFLSKIITDPSLEYIIDCLYLYNNSYYSLILYKNTLKSESRY